MNNYYYTGAAKIIGTDQVVMVKIKEGYMSAGHIVGFQIDGRRTLAEVICTTFVNEGGKEEAVINALVPAYEVEKIYHEYWTKPEEEIEDGN